MSLEELKRENAELKAANLELQNRVKLMQTIFDNLSEGVVASNLKGEFLLTNPSAVGIAGMQSEASPEDWSETYGTFYPDKVTPVPSSELPLYKAMKGEITNDVKLFLRNSKRPDGVFIRVSGRPLLDETGDLIGGVIALRDITQLETATKQLKTTANKLQTQNALMDAIFNSIGDGIIVADRAGKYVMFNETAKKWAGQDPGNVYIREASEIFGLFRPDCKQIFPSDALPLAKALRGEHPDDVEIWIHNAQLPEGLDVSISARPIYDENGAVNGGVSVIRDTSERKAAENQLKVMNDQLTVQSGLLRSVFDSMSDGVFVFDETGSIIITNPSARWMADMPPRIVPLDEWTDRYNFFYPDKVTPFPIYELPNMLAIRGESVDDLELFINSERFPEGIYVNTSGRPLLDNDGHRTGAVVVARDVTDKIKTEEAVAQAFAQGRLEMVDTILHNIGNAINSISVGIDTIHHQLTNDRLTPRLTALANAIEQHQDNFSDYLENTPQGQKVLPLILALSADFNAVKQQWGQTVDRIRARTGHIVDIIRTQNSYNVTGGLRKDINLTVAISDAIKMLQDSIEKRQIHIEIDCGNAPENIRIQESRFHQMLVNFIKNSVEAIDELVDSGQCTEAPRIQFRAYIEGDFFCLDITDNGIGIAPENTNKIFGAGFTTKEAGSGLGMHSSANFVISSGGKIEVLSEGKGKGTTVQIRLRYDSVYPQRF